MQECRGRSSTGRKRRRRVETVAGCSFRIGPFVVPVVPGADCFNEKPGCRAARRGGISGGYPGPPWRRRGFGELRAHDAMAASAALAGSGEGAASPCASATRDAGPGGRGAEGERRRVDLRRFALGSGRERLFLIRLTLHALLWFRPLGRVGGCAAKLLLQKPLERVQMDRLELPEPLHEH